MDVVNSTFKKCKSMVRRPLEINFTDAKGSQRVSPLEVFYVDENRLKNDDLAYAQFNSYVSGRKVRVVAENIDFNN